MNQAVARAQFTEQLTRAETALELDRAALLIAAETYPMLDVDAYLAQLDDIATHARVKDDPTAPPLMRILRLNETLFETYGFRGNTDSYFDARNSFLNDVMDRRTGIPITLSVIYLEVARRLGLTLAGVGLPGHFIVKYQDDREEILIDPFHEGRLLSEDDCFKLILQMYQGRIVFEHKLLNAVTKRQILARMLQNLKGIYARAQDHAKTLSVIERVMLIQPADVELRDRGLVLAELGRFQPAITDLEKYLHSCIDDNEAKAVRAKLNELKQKHARLN